MKNSLDTTIDQIKKRKRIGIMAHLVTGYPTFAVSKKIAKALVKGGADIIEIQIPFSDPMADGVLIVEACRKSIDTGTKVKDSFILAKFINQDLNTPVVLMTYANIVIHMGIKNFCVVCKEHSISGLIVPDLPYDSEECKVLQKYATKAGIHIIYVISPAIENSRLQEIKKQASGFIYCTSRQGTTGTGKEFTKNINSYLARARKKSIIPLAVGFGITSLKDVKLIANNAQIAVIGSEIINIIKKNEVYKILPEITRFVSQLSKE